jgi:hypothetical protein
VNAAGSRVYVLPPSITAQQPPTHATRRVTDEEISCFRK